MDYNNFEKNTIIINESSNNKTVINIIGIKNNYKTDDTKEPNSKNKKNNGNHNKEKQSIRVANREKIDKMIEKMDKMGRDISKIKEDITDIKTGINTMNANITGLRTEITGLRTEVTGLRTEVTGLRTEVGKGLNNLVFTNYLIAMMLFLLISIIIYQIKNNN